MENLDQICNINAIVSLSLIPPDQLEYVSFYYMKS